MNRFRIGYRQGRWQLFVAVCLSMTIASDSLAGPTVTQRSMIPPVMPACISSPFGPRILPDRPLAGNFHNGIDLPAPIGSPVRAVAPGTVIRIQRHGIGGLEVLIQHAGFIGVYSHLGLISPTLALGGKSIFGGERIATVGRTGLTYGPHLYFGMIMGGQPVDPAPFLAVTPCGTAAPAAQSTLLRPTRLFAEQ